MATTTKPDPATFAHPATRPGCNVDLVGKEIPEDQRAWYGGQTHYSRVQGLYVRQWGRTMAWCCPDCGHVWGRE